jgi:hypothetical protein
MKKLFLILILFATLSTTPLANAEDAVEKFADFMIKIIVSEVVQSDEVDDSIKIVFLDEDFIESKFYPRMIDLTLSLDLDEITAMRDGKPKDRTIKKMEKMMNILEKEAIIWYIKYY